MIVEIAIVSIYVVATIISKWLDKKFPSTSWNVKSSYKPTYPLEHEPPKFNQSYSTGHAVKKLENTKPIFTKNETEYLKSINQFHQDSSNKTKKQHKKEYKPPLNLDIEYVDANGEYTRRTIRVTQYRKGQQWNHAITGHCRLKGDERTFRFDRILSCTDADTGRKITNPKALIDDFYDR